MTTSSLEFDPETALGRAFRIDTASVWAEAVDHELLTRVSVGSLVAFQGASSSEYLIGVLDRVTRDLQEEALVEEPGDEGEVPLETRQRDLLRVVLLGTYRTVDGVERDTFRRCRQLPSRRGSVLGHSRRESAEPNESAESAGARRPAPYPGSLRSGPFGVSRRRR